MLRGKQKLQIEELSRALIFTFHILGTYFYNFLKGYDGKFYVIFIFSHKFLKWGGRYGIGKRNSNVVNYTWSLLQSILSEGTWPISESVLCNGSSL